MWRCMPALGWLKKGSWSVVDQALFSGANFVLNILLARWLVPRDYGAFTVAFTLFLLLGLFHTALLTEPMLVYGAGRFRGRFEPYMRALLRGHAAFSVAGLVVLGVAGFLVERLSSEVVGGTLILLALTQPLILLLWITRRACYVHLRPRLAAAGGVVYAALLLPATFALASHGVLNAATALAAMGVASLVSALWLMNRMNLHPWAAAGSHMLGEAAGRHWAYGRWAVATGMLTWITGQLAALILPLWAGLEATASFKALMNLTMPAVQAYVSFAVLIVPALVRAREGGHFRRFLMFSVALVSGAMLAYWLLLGLWGEPLMVWLYGGQYAHHSSLLWLVGCLPLLSGAVALLAGALKALERPDQVFGAYAVSSLVVLTVGALMIYRGGLLGAVLCQVVAMTACATVLAYLVLKSTSASETPRVAQTAAVAEADEAAPATAS